MQLETIQKRIYTGYAQTAKRVGGLYAVYRTDSPFNPIAPENLVATLPVAFAAEHTFVRAVKYTYGVRIAYADGTQLQQRDLLVGPYGTFFIGDMQPTLPMQIVRTNDVVSIDRISYTTIGTITRITTPIASGLPAHMELKRIIIKNPAFGGTSTGTAVSEWLAYLPLPQGSIKQDDIVTDQAGVEYEIDAVEYSEIGYIASIRQAQAS